MSTLPAVKEMEVSVDDVKKYIAPTATDKELFMFMGIAKSYGLNPLKREIHFVKRKSKDANGNWVEVGSSIVGYEVYLKRAERTGKLDGWKCWIEKDGIGEKAIIEIRRKDQSMPITWEVYRKEFDTEKSTWLKMPSFMLKKVAIAQGFRLAFPDDLGGMPYIPEELPHTADNTTSEQLSHAPIDIKPSEDVQDFKEPDLADRFTSDKPEKVSTYPGPAPGLYDGEYQIAIIRGIDKREGEKNGKKWIKYVLTDEYTSTYSTFDKALADQATDDMVGKLPVKLWFVKSKFGNDLKAITAADWEPVRGLEGGDGNTYGT